MRGPCTRSNRIPAAVMCAFGLAALMATVALSTPTQAAMRSSQPLAASQGAPGIDGGPAAIPPSGFKGLRISPNLPTLSVAGWTIVPEVILGAVRRAVAMDRVIMPTPRD